MLVCCYPYVHPCFSCQLTLSVYIDCSRAYSVFLTDLFSFASFLPFPPQVLREGILEFSWIYDRLLVGFQLMYGLDMKLAMVITYFGDSTYVFQFFSDVVFIQTCVFGKLTLCCTRLVLKQFEIFRCFIYVIYSVYIYTYVLVLP